MNTSFGDNVNLGLVLSGVDWLVYKVGLKLFIMYRVLIYLGDIFDRLEIKMNRKIGMRNILSCK